MVIIMMMMMTLFLVSAVFDLQHKNKDNDVLGTMFYSVRGANRVI